MRLRGGQIRFLAADEPSSALDPEAEYELFTRLRGKRGGMTTVFITHRFGHVTKHADLILYALFTFPRGCYAHYLINNHRFSRCLKEGELVEQGTHEELMRAGGLYYSMWIEQASHMEYDVLPESKPEM